MLIGAPVPGAAEVWDRCARQLPRAKVAPGEYGVPVRSFRNAVEPTPENDPGGGWGEESLACRVSALLGGRARCDVSCWVGTAGDRPASQASGRCGKGPPRRLGTLAEPSGLQGPLPPPAAIARGIQKNKQALSHSRGDGAWGGGVRRPAGALGTHGSKGASLQLGVSAGELASGANLAKSVGATRLTAKESSHEAPCCSARVRRSLRGGRVYQSVSYHLNTCDLYVSSRPRRAGERT